MSKLEKFINFMEVHGCSVVVTQEDDGSGYTVTEVTLPHDDAILNVTVQS